MRRTIDDQIATVTVIRHAEKGLSHTTLPLIIPHFNFEIVSNLEVTL